MDEQHAMPNDSIRNSIFMKIVLVFLCLMLTLYSLHLYINKMSAEVVRSEIINSMAGKVELYISLIEEDFSRVIHLIQTYVNDDDLLKLSTMALVMSDAERTEAILSLKSKLDLVKNSSRFVHNVSAFIPLLNRSVTANEQYIAAFDREQFEALSVTTNRYQDPFLVWDGKLFISQYRWFLALLTFGSAVVIVFFAFSLHRMIQRPLRTLVRTLSKVESGNLHFTLSYPHHDEFGYLYHRFQAMVKQVKALIHEVYESKYRMRLAELKQLQSQINPHFLYNSFFLLHRMAKREDYENITRFTAYLGEYYQFITRDGETDTWLRDEVKHAQNYIDIQLFRFGSRIRCQFGELPVEAEGLRVPRLILQPIVENAFKHGLENKLKDGQLCVSFRKQGGSLVIVVEDNGEGMDVSKLRELQLRMHSPKAATASSGLANVHRRLQMMYGPDYGLYLSLAAEGGLKAEIKLPLSNSER